MIDTHWFTRASRDAAFSWLAVLCFLLASTASTPRVVGQEDTVAIDVEPAPENEATGLDTTSSMPAVDDVFVESQSEWKYFARMIVPPLSATESVGSELPPLVDLILGPEVFSHARTDLADLRLFDSTNEVLPYSLRTLAPKSIREVVTATEFNRTEPKTGPQELTLELQPEVVQHNEIQILLTGEDFRRAVEVDASEDGKQWRHLVAANLVRFTDGEQKIDTKSLVYEDSRLRFVRVRVQPDPNPANSPAEGDLFEITEVKVLRTVDVPGERIVWDAAVGKREPTRVFGTPASSWTIDLQGTNVPCDQIEVEVDDTEFVRDVELQIEQPSGPLGQMAFISLYIPEYTNWQRKLGEPKRLMKLSFPEVQAGRLRLVVADYRNAPLTIRAVKASASARQVIFARPTPPESELRLFFGNPLAELPKYDFAGNLAENPVVSERADLQETVENPDFVPPPQPFTERFPWLIYAVLGAVAVALLVVIANLAKTAIVIHDAQSSEPQVAK